MEYSRFQNIELFVIGTSAGGVNILSSVLPAFKKTAHYKVAVVIHMPPSGPNLIPSLFEESCTLKIKEAEPGETLYVDHIYVAPPDYHLLIEPNKTLSLSTEGPVHYSRPSIDVLFESAAFSLGKRTAGILLTGANDDGAVGLRKIKELGGVTIVQEPEDSEFKTMPLSAIHISTPDFVLKKEQIIELIDHLCSQEMNL